LKGGKPEFSLFQGGVRGGKKLLKHALNFITGSAIAVTAGSVLYLFSNFFVPPLEAVGEGRAILYHGMQTL
jgi:hypothetical protein